MLLEVFTDLLWLLTEFLFLLLTVAGVPDLVVEEALLL